MAGVGASMGAMRRSPEMKGKGGGGGGEGAGAPGVGIAGGRSRRECSA
jgi:hypothetical protein